MTPAEYDAWYDSPRGRWIGETEFRLLQRLLALRPGETLLDVGCGSGWFTRRFAAAGKAAAAAVSRHACEARDTAGPHRHCASAARTALGADAGVAAFAALIAIARCSCQQACGQNGAAKRGCVWCILADQQRAANACA